MHLTEEELKQIVKEELTNLINEDEIDEKLFSALKNIGKGLLSKASNIFSTKPEPNKSQGVGRAFARYQVPQKQPTKQEPQQKPTTALAIRPSSAIGEPQISEPDIERGTARARLKTRPELPAAQSPQKQPLKTSGELPASENIPLQLAAPKKIGILKDYGSLMSSTEEQDYKNLHDNSIAYFSKTRYYSNLNQQQKIIATKNIDTVLKHLVATKRIIQNPTIGPVDEQESRKTPSLQQIGEIDFNSWYARSLISTTKKYFGNSIPGEIIEFVIKFLFQSGRLAISQRLFNQLIHTNDPRVGPTDELDSEQQTQQKESINYKKLYESWKIYAKTGVKI
jgi:hypothetical protein